MVDKVGSLRDRVTIQQETRVEDGGGGASTVWIDIQTVYANVAPVSSNTRIVALAQALMMTHKVTIRYRNDIDLQANRYRLLWRGQVLRIVSVTTPDPPRTYWEIICNAGQEIAA